VDLRDSPALLAIRNASYSYHAGARPVLEDLDFEIYPGEVVLILGAEASGKSTLLKLAAGALVPTRGTVLLDGKDAPGGVGRFFPSVSYLMQFPERQFFASSLGKEVGFAAERRGRSPESVSSAVSEALANVSFPRSEPLLERPPWAFSLGEQRRIALASVLVSQPRLLVLDEPAAGLDPPFRRTLVNLLSERAREGIAVLLATHDLALCQEIATRVVFLEAGKLRAITPSIAEDREWLALKGWIDPPGARAPGAPPPSSS